MTEMNGLPEASAGAAVPVVARKAVALEIGSDGWCLTHYPAVPGAGFKAASVAAAIEQLDDRWTEEIRWLSARGLQPLAIAADDLTSSGGKIGGLQATGSRGFEVIEVIQTDVLAATGDTEAYLRLFGQSLTPSLVEQGLAYLAAGRASLLALVAAQPADWLDLRPAQGKRSPREVLHHLADAELFYLVRLWSDQAEARELWARWSGRGEPELQRLAAIRERFVATIESLAEDRRALVTVHDPHAERWTPFKVLYRAIWHERYTTRLL